MRPFHWFIVRLVIGLCLFVLIAMTLQRANSTSKPAEKPAAVSALESENA